VFGRKSRDFIKTLSTTMHHTATFYDMMDELQQAQLTPGRLREQLDDLYSRLTDTGAGKNEMARCTYCEWIDDDYNMEHRQCVLCQEPVITCDDCESAMYIEKYHCFVCRDCIESRGTSSEVEEREKKLSDCVTWCHCCAEELVLCEVGAQEATRACDACCRARLFDCEKCRARDDIEPHRTLCKPCEKKEPRKREKVVKNRLAADAAAAAANKKRTETEELASDRVLKRAKYGDNDDSGVDVSNAVAIEI
jgi:hypothetical protein